MIAIFGLVFFVAQALIKLVGVHLPIRTLSTWLIYSVVINFVCAILAVHAMRSSAGWLSWTWLTIAALFAMSIVFILVIAGVAYRNDKDRFIETRLSESAPRRRTHSWLTIACSVLWLYTFFLFAS